MLIRPLESTVSAGNAAADGANRWSRPETVKLALLLLFGALTIWFTLRGISPGHRSFDELNYHLMVRSLWQSGSLSLLNGYQDFPSTAFLWSTTVVHNGQLVSQYPTLHAIVAFPFYALPGYPGLFLLNASAVCVAVRLCYRIALRIFGDRNLALNACLIFALATYIWGYALAAWPHALSCMIILAAVYFALCAYQAATRRRAASSRGSSSISASATSASRKAGSPAGPAAA